MTTARDRSHYTSIDAGQRVALTAILLAYLGLSLGYAAATPAWNNPDEPAHYNYIAAVAETGQLPEMRPGDANPARLEPLIRSHFPDGTALDWVRYESWQPPMYYLLGAFVFRLSPADPPQARLDSLHFFNIVLGAATLFVSYLIGREVFARLPILSDPHQSWIALAVPATLIGIPMFTSTSAAINNDNLANLLGGLIMLASLRAVVSPPSDRSAMLLGCLLALGVLTKLTVGLFAPIALAAIVVRGLRHAAGGAQIVRETLLLTGVVLLVMAPWLVRQGLTYGWDDLLAKRRHDAVMAEQAIRNYELSYLHAQATRLFDSAWGLFGWMKIASPQKLYAFWAGLCQVALFGLVVYAIQRWAVWGTSQLRRRAGWQWSLDLRLGLLMAAAVGALTVVAAYNVTTDVQPQGRFLFVAIGPMCVLLVLGWAALLPVGLRLRALALLDLTLVVLNVYTLQTVVRPAFAPA